MFGSFRFVLAGLVVLTHIGGIEIVAGVAVWGFFMLSGFLMTAILNGKYGFSRAGLVAFASNRVLRLLPTYWVSVLLAATLVRMFGAAVDPRFVNESLAMPETAREVLANLLIVGHTTLGIGRIVNALSPSAWAIDIEIMMYGCSCLFLARNERLNRVVLQILLIAFPVLWLAAKYVIARGEIELGNQLIYSFLPAALVPYSIGTHLWFSRERMNTYLTSPNVLVLAVVGIFVCVFGVGRFSVTAVYVLVLPLLAILIRGLARVDRHQPGFQIDDLLGRMSYPIYLTQWSCAYVVVLLAPTGWNLFRVTDNHLSFGMWGFWAVSVVILVVSLLFAVLVEGPIEKVRHKFMNRLVGSATQRIAV